MRQENVRQGIEPYQSGQTGFPIAGGEDLGTHQREGDFDLLRHSVLEVRKIQSVDDGSVQRYVDFLNHPRNRSHFATPPVTVEEFRTLAQNDLYHPLVGINGLGEVIGGAVIHDARHPLHDHFVELFVVDPDLQGHHVGTSMMKKVIDWASTTQTGEKCARWRRKLDLAIIKDVPGWERMRQLVQGLGFQRVSTLQEQVSVIVERGGMTVFSYKPTQRYEMNLARWRTIRDLPVPPIESPEHFSK